MVFVDTYFYVPLVYLCIGNHWYKLCRSLNCIVSNGAYFSGICLMAWKRFTHYWSFVGRIPQSSVDAPHGQQCGASRMSGCTRTVEHCDEVPSMGDPIWIWPGGVQLYFRHSPAALLRLTVADQLWLACLVSVVRCIFLHGHLKDGRTDGRTDTGNDNTLGQHWPGIIKTQLVFHNHQTGPNENVVKSSTDMFLILFVCIDANVLTAGQLQLYFSSTKPSAWVFVYTHPF